MAEGHATLTRLSRQSRRRTRGLAPLSRRRAPLFAEDAGSLSARRAAIPGLFRRSSRWRAVARGRWRRCAADVRAFMAARRAAEISSRSLMRSLAGVRGFGRFLERNGKGKVGALTAVRGRNRQDPAAAVAGCRRQAPGRPRPCRRRRTRAVDPRPRRQRCWRCSMAAACAFPKRSASSAALLAAWRGRRRHRYRQGRQAAHGPGAAAGREIDRRLSYTLPYTALPRGPLFLGTKGRAAVAARGPTRYGAAARRARPARDARPRTRFGIPSPPIFSAAAAICGRSRSCSGMPRWGRRRFIPKSTPSG